MRGYWSKNVTPVERMAGVFQPVFRLIEMNKKHFAADPIARAVLPMIGDEDFSD